MNASYKDIVDTIVLLLEPIKKYLDDPGITDILINDDNNTWIEKDGELREVSEKVDPKDLITVSSFLASLADKEANDKTPSVSGILPFYNMRFQMTIPPVVITPTLALRRPCSKVFYFKELLKAKTITKKQVDLIKKALSNRENIIVAGSVGSGKTTFVNTLLQELKGDRLYIIEDTKELQTPNENRVFILTTNTYLPITAVKDALRYRPDRIIFGELRDGETALELLKAWNTGHRGGISTIHANSAKDTLLRLEQLISEVSVNSKMDLIKDACDLIIFMQKDKGRRYVKEILYKGEYIND